MNMALKDHLVKFSLKAKKENITLAGITISAEGIALAIIDHTDIAPILKFVQFYPCSPIEQVPLLTELVREHQLDEIPCNLLLSPDEYQLTQIDAPEVSKQELSSALRWQIKDLIDFHIDDAVIDHIELPNHSASGKKQLLVIASRQSIIQTYVDLLQAANCNLTSIDVAVQAARNIISHLHVDNNSVGLLNLWDSQSKISVLLDNDIYINRSSSIGSQSLSFVTEEDINSQSILDSLVLELQRTFDYYEGHSRQAAITHLVIINNGQTVNTLDQLIQQRLGVECINVNLKDAVTISSGIKHTISNNCIIAIGGALRSVG